METISETFGGKLEDENQNSLDFVFAGKKSWLIEQAVGVF